MYHWVQECLDAAVRYEERAVTARDPAARSAFAECAGGWRELARCWGELTRLPPLPDSPRHKNHASGVQQSWRHVEGAPSVTPLAHLVQEAPGVAGE
jgi:hypothetical protein